MEKRSFFLRREKSSIILSLKRNTTKIKYMYLVQLSIKYMHAFVLFILYLIGYNFKEICTKYDVISL